MEFTRGELQRGVFRLWMRTGLWFPIPEGALTEEKYNHWHDPANGRFTYRGTGRHDGGPEAERPRGGFGGGGASGGWGVRPRSTPPRPRNAEPTQSEGPSAFLLPTAKPAPTRVPETKPVAAKPLPKPQPKPASKPEVFRVIIRNGYRWRIDKLDRLRFVDGELRLGTVEPRSRALQAAAGKPDRRPTDDGGHYIAPRFNGPREAFNHFAQDANFNRGTYRLIENEWAAGRRAGHRVIVKLNPLYSASSKRPEALDITWYIDGEKKSFKIPNENQGVNRVRN
jgi:hypothetical protein